MSLFGLFEQRNVEDPTRPLTDASLLDLVGGEPVEAGVTVTPESSMSMSAVYRAASLISSVSAALPLHAYTKGTKNRVDSELLDNPHPDLTRYELWRLSYLHRCLWGNSYLQKIGNRKTGEIKELRPIHPSKVKVGKATPSRLNPSGKVFQITDDRGEEHALTPREILHIPALGYDGVTGVSPIRLAAQGIGTALAAERYSGKLFGSGVLLSGILQVEQRLKDGQAEQLQNRWKAKMAGMDRAHEVAVLDSGAKFEPLTMPNTDAQLLESRRFQITEVGRFFGVPPFLLMETEKSTSWGTGLEQQAQGFVTFDLHPQWLAPTEQRVTKELLLTGTEYAKYTMEGLLRGDSQARAEFYTALRNAGAFSANDIRDREDLPPIENGDGYLQPLNFVPLGTDPSQTTGGAGDGSTQPPEQ